MTMDVKNIRWGEWSHPKLQMGALLPVKLVDCCICHSNMYCFMSQSMQHSAILKSIAIRFTSLYCVMKNRNIRTKQNTNMW